METLKQKQYHPYPMSRQILELFAVKNSYLDQIPVPEVQSYLEKMDSYVETTHPEVIKTLEEKRAFDDALTAAMKAAIDEFVATRK